MPQFSFVIPVYNGGEHLQECLESLLSQTFEDIEVICVDDASTDNSREVLQSYAQKDARVHVVEQPENRGSARARRRGVLASRGAYVAFCDQDDSYERNACEILFHQLSVSPVDILQYGTHVINEGGVEQGEIEGLGAWLTPYEGHLSGRAILDECFVHLRFGYSLWNKVYEGGLARRAFAALEDVSVPLGEDNYASFSLFYFATTYRSIPERLYIYHYGRGYTGHTHHSAASFERTGGLVVAADLIGSFLSAQGSFDAYADTYHAARRHMLRYTFDRWAVEVVAQDQARALCGVIASWPYAEVIGYVAQDRPRDLAALFDARFGPVSKEGETDEFDVARRELKALSDACRKKDTRLVDRRQAFENSRAYRIGRTVTAPLRHLRGV